jgi:dipeptidyl aminopeptidase/acylaminoacyl peptidase
MLLHVDYPGDINLLRFSPAGTRLAVASDRREAGVGKVVVVLDIPSGKEVARHACPDGVQDVVFRSEDEWFLFHGFECLRCGPKTRPRRLTGERDLGDDPKYLTAGAAAPDGATLAVGTYGALLLADLRRGLVGRRIPAPVAGYVYAAAFSPDGRYLAVSWAPSEYTYISFVLVWDRRQEKCVRLLKLDAENVGAPAFRPDNQMVAVVPGNGSRVSCFAMKADRRREYLDELSPRTFVSERNLLYGMAWSEPVAVHDSGTGMIQQLQFSADGKILQAVGYGGSAVRLYARGGRVLSHTKPPEGYAVGTTAVSERGLAAGVVKDSRAVLLWDLPRWGEP